MDYPVLQSLCQLHPEHEVNDSERKERKVAFEHLLVHFHQQRHPLRVLLHEHLQLSEDGVLLEEAEVVVLRMDLGVVQERNLVQAEDGHEHHVVLGGELLLQNELDGGQPREFADDVSLYLFEGLPREHLVEVKLELLGIAFDVLVVVRKFL